MPQNRIENETKKIIDWVEEHRDEDSESVIDAIGYRHIKNLLASTLPELARGKCIKAADLTAFWNEQKKKALRP